MEASSAPDSEDQVVDPQPSESPEGPSSIPLSVLPEELRGKSEQEIAITLDRMTEGTRQGARRIHELERQIRELQERSTPSHAREPREPVDDDFDITKAIISDKPEDVRRAVLQVLVDAGLDKRLANVETSLGSTISRTSLSEAQRSLPNFNTYREEIEELLDERRVVKSYENLEDAYYYVVGRHGVKKAAKKAIQSDQPKPDISPDEEEPDFDDLTVAISRNMGVSPEELAEYMTDGPYTIKVPGEE